MDSFIALADSGRNEWWRYALSFALILFLWLGIGSIPLVLVVVLNGGFPFPWQGEVAAGPMSGLDPFITFYLPVSFSFIMLALGIVIAARFIHGRKLMTLVAGAPAPDFQRLGKGFALFIALNLLATIISFALEPSAFVLSLDAARLLLIAPLYIALTALQVSAEELMFRGYLLQGLGRLIRSPYLAALLSSIVFMSLHLGNPEASVDFASAALYYLYIGFWFCLITLKDGRSELAIGAHAANNMFILLVNYESSALEIIPSVFKNVGIGGNDIALSLGVFVLFSIIAYVALFHKKGILRG